MAALVFALALSATELHPPLALPLMAGGLASTALAVRALWRHWDLLDRLLGDRSAYVIPEVRARAMRQTTLKRRRVLAGAVRKNIEQPLPGIRGRISPVLEELEELARELEDERLTLAPESAVACARLLTDGFESPLLNATVPADELRCRVRQIRAGFSPGETAV